MKFVCFRYLAILLLLDQASLFAQQPDCTHRRIVASVLDREGKPVSGLSTTDFRATIHEKPARIVSVNADAQPRRIVIVLDSSGSARSNWRVARAVIEAVIKSAPEDSFIALMAFNDDAYLSVPLTQARRRVLDWLAMVDRDPTTFLRHSTSMYDAILSTISLLTPSFPGDAIILVGDGEDNSSRAGYQDVETSLTEVQARFFAVLLPGDRTNKRLHKLAERNLSSLASASGGELAVLESGKDGYRAFREGDKKITFEPPRLVADFLASMRLLYRLEVDVGEEVKKSTELKLELLMAPDPERDAPKLNFPHILIPCEALK